MKEQKQEGKIFCIFDSTKVELNECTDKAFEIFLNDQINYQEKIEKN